MDKDVEALKADIISLVPIQHQEDVRQKIDDLVDAVEKSSEVRILNSPFKLIDWEHATYSNSEEEE